MYPWISRTLDFWLQFCEKKCGLYMDVYGTFDLPLGELQMHEKEASLTKRTSDFGCQVNTRGVQLMMKSTETQTDKSSFEVILCD